MINFKIFSKPVNFLCSLIFVAFINVLAVLVVKKNYTDVYLWGSWSKRVHDSGLGSFYTNTFPEVFAGDSGGGFGYDVNPNRFPTDAYIVKAISWIYTNLGGESFNDNFWIFTIAIPSLVFSLISAILLFIFLKTKTEFAGMWSLSYYILIATPVTVFYATWESVALAIALTAIILSKINRFFFVSSGILWALAFWERPFVAIMALILIETPLNAKNIKDIIYTTLVALFSTILLIIPLGLNLGWDSTNGNLFKQAVYSASGFHERLTFHASNFWTIVVNFVENDSRTTFMGISGKSISFSLTLIVLIALIYYSRFIKKDIRSVWLATSIGWCWYYFANSLTERYSYFILILTIILAVKAKEKIVTQITLLLLVVYSLSIMNVYSGGTNVYSYDLVFVFEFIFSFINGAFLLFLFYWANKERKISIDVLKSN